LCFWKLGSESNGDKDNVDVFRGGMVFLTRVELSKLSLTQIKNCKAVIFHFIWNGDGNDTVSEFANKIKNIIEDLSFNFNSGGEYDISLKNSAFVESKSVQEVIDGLAKLKSVYEVIDGLAKLDTSKMNFNYMNTLITKIKGKVEHAYDIVLFGMLQEVFTGETWKADALDVGKFKFGPLATTFQKV
jgi:hypothetical protein